MPYTLRVNGLLLSCGIPIYPVSKLENHVYSIRQNSCDVYGFQLGIPVYVYGRRTISGKSETLVPLGNDTLGSQYRMIDANVRMRSSYTLRVHSEYSRPARYVSGQINPQHPIFLLCTFRIRNVVAWVPYTGYSCS